MSVRWSRSIIPLCWFNRHSPVRKEASWDGKSYLATCRFCSEPIHRRSRGDWRKDERIRLA